MNPEIPEERKYIEELTQEYIYLSEELDYDKRYEVKGKDIYDREEISKILIKSRNLYTGKRLLRRLEILYEAIQIEIKRTAKNHSRKTNEALTIYNCENNRHFLFYLEHKSRLLRYINILKEDPPVREYERQYIQDEYRSEITIIIQKQVPTADLFEFRPYNHKYNYEIPTRFLRNITKDYIDLQDSNQENNVVEQILSKEELNIKLQGLLDQIKIQIQTLQGQLTLEEAYKNHEYTFLFKRATAIYKTINGKELLKLEQKPNRNRQEESLAIKLITLTSLLNKLKDTYDDYYLPSITVYITINEYLKEKFEPKNPLRKEIEKFLVSKTDKEENWHFYDRVIKFHQELNTKVLKKLIFEQKTLLTLEGARNIQENDQATPIIFPNTGLTQATQNYLLQHHQQLHSEITTPRRNPRGYLQRIGTPIIIEAIGIVLQIAFGQTEIVKELSTLKTPRLKEYYKTALISISVNQGILEERIKEISIQSIEGEVADKIIETLLYINNTKELIQITDDIWETINDLINRINPTNNSRLGAILLMLEGAKSIAREFYPHVLEYNKQRPNKIPAHILTRTQTLFPELTGRALVKEQEKQRNIYNNFLDNTQAQIEGIKKRLLAESPEFCKIFEDNPETGETEFYYGDYNNQFTILPFRFHHLILHHLEAIDNILYSEGARNKIYFEEEESYESAYSEINKLSQEFIDKTKKVKELRNEKERLEQATDKIINRILLEDNKPIEKPKRTRSNSL
ncbi:hypothetical protein C2G38_2227844 [Gigaspora rosea]|uniref:Uncharacterized protein n=1 Tax=Gigaspora rosea TaxID=44941 RepID=A0A397U5U9_9GLOM|nr:hypothetical protein C2G38_2227844 [Gigaspora rosea]